MKKAFLTSVMVCVFAGCSGIAPEAERGEASPLVQPPFFEKDLTLLNKPVVEIYTKPTCGFCIKAKALLDAKGIAYVEYDLVKQPALIEESISRSKRMTVPQIFIKGEHVGGFAELEALNASGKLEEKVSN